ncbi:MAG: hypothetical protein AB7O49_06740 [Sphingomonadales bacterium]
MNKQNNIGRYLLAAGLAAAAVGTGSAAHASEFGVAVAQTKPILDVRVRYENVDQANFLQEADALTLRVRAGFETGKAWDTSFLAEFDWVESIVGDYNSTANGKTMFPTVADPQDVELNRLQLTNGSLPQTTITLGRQRINLDDQRFVGNVGWRQNEQTFDAVRVVNKSIPKLTVDLAYLIQVNRIFGPDSVQGRWNGDNFLANAGYDLGFGTLSVFGYWLNFRESAVNSSQTFGARFSGKQSFSGVTLNYAASVATQSDWKNNPIDYSVMYYMAEGSAAWKGIMVGGGWESLGGDGVKGFATPLATLHKFQGWADVFLTTPAGGITDTYAKAGYTMKNVGPFSSVSLLSFYHWFDSENGGADLGQEFDISLTAAYKKFEFTVKFADYDAETFGVDTQKIWFQIDYKL